jgi:uncharacterized protein
MLKQYYYEQYNSLDYLQLALRKTIFNNDTTNLKILVHIGADINKPDRYGMYPLHYAVIGHCDDDILKLLIECGAQVNVLDRRGNTPLSLALSSSNHSKQFIELLRY